MPTHPVEIDLHAYLAQVAEDFPLVGDIRLDGLRTPEGQCALLMGSPAAEVLKEQLWHLCKRGELPGVTLSHSIEGAKGTLTLTWPEMVEESERL